MFSNQQKHHQESNLNPAKLTIQSSRALRQMFFLNGPIPASFFFIFVFSRLMTANKCSKKFADDWIQTADLWYRRLPTEPQPLRQMG